MSVLYRLPGRATRVLLAGMRDTFRLTLEYARGSDLLTPEDLRLMRFLARDPRTIIASFDLEPSIREYICCPACFALYSDFQSAPETCTYRSTKTSRPCGAKLWRKRCIRGKTMRFPVRKYLHQLMSHWLGRLLCREEIEKCLGAPRTATSTGPMKDIFDGLALRRFRAPGEEKPFLEGPADELRLIFSLSVDGFNPFQMKEAKQTVTSTAIYMVCLNLPPHLRYRPENMYLVGVIPGPLKPSTEQINHFIALLVDELLVFWSSGVYYKRTAMHSSGRRSRAAMIPLVCDLLGARQVAGLGQHNHTYMLCTCCHIAQDGIEDFTTFQPRDLHAHIAAAIAWRDAESTYEREELFSRSGIRWSELLRLSYWNPILYVVVDSMHNLYLGLLQRHIRDIWGVSASLADGDASGQNTTKAPPRPSLSVMSFGLNCLLHGSDAQLAACAKPVLYHLCVDHDLRRAGTARMLLKHLTTWVCYSIIYYTMTTAAERNSFQRNREGLPKPTPVGASVPSPQPAANALGEQTTGHRSPLKLVGTGGGILLSATSSNALVRRGLGFLREMCRLRSLATGGTRADLANRLWTWVCS